MLSPLLMFSSTAGYEPVHEPKFRLNSGQIRTQNRTFSTHVVSEEISGLLGMAQGSLGK